jgi:hypothetical protein
MALANLGIIPTSTVSITSPVTKEDRACATFYAVARKKMLAMADWPFARKNAVLTEDTAFEDPEYGYVYALPSDYVRALRLEPVRASVSAVREPFRIGLKSNDTALRLFCDVEPETSVSPVLQYTADISTGSPAVYAGLYPQVFGDALAWDVAARIAAPLRIEPKNIALARQMARMTLEEAFGLLVGEGHEDDPPDAEHVRARS